MAKGVVEDVEIISNRIPKETDIYEQTFLIKRTTAIILMITGLIILLILIVNFATMIFMTSAAASVTNSEEVEEKSKKLEHSSRIPVENIIIIEENNTKLHLIDRYEWIAQPPANDLSDLVLPVNKIIIAHTATENCTNQAACIFRVRFIQTFHMEARGWDDIGYNFLVGGDGLVYVGRGWDKVGAHTKGQNAESICIAFIGTFTQSKPPTMQLDAAKLLIEEGIKLNKISEDYGLYGHRQFSAFESPGDALYNIITTWPHWRNVD